MQQMVLEALENQKRISATIDVTDAILRLCKGIAECYLLPILGDTDVT